MTTDLPTGTVTFLFTDIEGSTRLWEQHPERMGAAVARHDSLLTSAITANHGRVIKTTGDGILAVFTTAMDGVGAVLAAQRAMLVETWPEIASLRVRMALHTGEGELREGDYFGAALNRTARLMAIASGGQSLVSQATAMLIQDRLPPEVSLCDLGEHRLKDLVQPEHVFQIVAADLPADFPPLSSPGGSPNNLPVQLTSFVGRHAELAEARRLLSATRLLTFTGPGGTGKTRLALELAAQALPDYPAGAWSIELAPLADAAYILPAIAAVFSLREISGRDLSAVVTDYLRNKNLLLLLDNCEHLIEACARLADELLHACPQLKIIASSREALGLAGETAYRVPSLALPGAQAASPETLLDSEAARLFVERAQAAQPRFALTASNTAAVAAICTRLDGIPLAIELAAARVKLLSAEQIAARLDDRFRLLVGGSRTAMPRQQTLRALIDWSYDLLPQSERHLFRQMAVFSGGASLEAVEAVGARPDALDLLAGLVNKSLVVADDQGASVRYRFLETVRQYALEKLLEAAESKDARDRHLEFYLQMTEAAELELIGPRMVAWLDDLDAEKDNLRAALEWALANHPLAALRLAAVLHFYWAKRASLVEGTTWLQTALSRAEAAPPGDRETTQRYLAARAKALEGLSSLAFELGDNTAARAASEACIAQARQIDAWRTLALALGMGATICAFAGDVQTARTWADESIALCHRYGFSYELAMIAGAQTFLAVVEDRPTPPNAREDILRAARASGNPWAIGLATQNLGRFARVHRDFELALSDLKEAEALFIEINDRHFINSSRSEIAHVLREQGRFPEAKAAYHETIRAWQETSQYAAAAHELECFALIAAAEGQNNRAARLFGAAEALRESIGSAMTPMERREYDPAVADLRAGMDAAVFRAAWEGGRMLTLDRAIQEASLET